MFRTHCCLQNTISVFLVALALAFACVPCASAQESQSKLDAALAGVQIPPPWMADTPVNYDTGKPWKETRLHIRGLLAQGGDKAREGIKLTYLYIVVNKTAPDDHEYSMYCYLGGEYAWATKVYLDRLASRPEGHTHEYLSLASLLMRYDESKQAIALLQDALARLPKPPWDVPNKAGINEKLGDINAELGDTDAARRHYEEAMELYPTSKQPYGRHLLPRRVAKIRAKLAMMEQEALDIAALRDGTYRGKSLGYAKDLFAILTIREGRITDVKVEHEEKIEQGATKTVPAQIVEKQSLKVDAITGATVTTQAIVDACYNALKHAPAK